HGQVQVVGTKELITHAESEAGLQPFVAVECGEAQDEGAAVFAVHDRRGAATEPPVENESVMRRRPFGEALVGSALYKWAGSEQSRGVFDVRKVTQYRLLRAPGRSDWVLVGNLQLPRRA